MNSIPMLSSILGLAFASGVNLYAAVLVVGLGVRLGWISGLPGELQVLANPFILGAAGLMYLLEFFADKIPYVSIAWDAIHTFIRPLGGAALALASTAKLSPEVQALAMLAGGSVALSTHSTKMGYRLIAHASPEPVSDSVFSLVEDFGVVGLVLLVYKHPLPALILIAALLAGVAIVLPWILRVLSFVFRGVMGRFTSLVPAGSRGAVPPWLAEQLGSEAPGSVYPCFARRISGAPWMQRGYLILDGPAPRFAYRGWFRPKLISMDRAGLNVHRGLLFDLADAGPWAVYFTKDARVPVLEGPGLRGTTA